MSDTELMTMLIAFTAIALIGALSSRFGADSRPGFDESAPLS